MARGAYGPWNSDVAPELREPFSYMGHTSGGNAAARPAHPVAQLVWTTVLLAVAVAGLALTVPKVADDKAALVPVVVLVAFVAVIGWSYYVAFTRLAWVGRVRSATGMSPFEMARKGIDPPRT